MECPIGSIFDSKTKSCELITKAECPFGGICPDPRVEISVPHLETCSAYYKCKKGKATLLQCEDGLHYNAAKQVCDTPANAKCPIITDKVEEITDIEISCPSSGSFFYPHPLNCSHYYICHNGKSTLMSCGRILKYDFLSQTCNLPNHSKCIVDFIKPSNNQGIIMQSNPGVIKPTKAAKNT